MKDKQFIPVGEEYAFIVHRFRRSMAHLIVTFAGYRPDSAELLVLKCVVPEFAEVSIVNLPARVSGPSLRLGPYRYIPALEILERLKQKGLRVEANPYTAESALLIDERGPAAWLIEDEKDNAQVIEDAIRRGVREKIQEED